MRAFGHRYEWPVVPDAAYVPGLFTLEECQAIINRWYESRVTEDKIPVNGRLYRDTDIRWIQATDPDAGWIADRIDSAVARWNEQVGFDMETCADFQLGYYAGGQHYEWHLDLGSKGNSRRKVSVVVMLTPRDQFEGGLLQILRAGGRIETCDLQVGGAVLFPAWMKHRVTPVISGGRWTLVAWYSGPPFR